MTAADISRHLEMLRALDPEYADYARGWFWELLGKYLR
jgi:hypothetical protein